MRRELTHLLEEQSQTIITTIEEGSENAIASFNLVQDLIAERLLNNAALIEELDYHGLLTREKCSQIAKDNNIFRINVFDESGQRVMSSFSSPGRGGTQFVHEGLFKQFEQSGSDELVLGFHSGRYSTAQRFAVAKKRRKGGAIILNTTAEQMLEFRRFIGVGRLVQDISKNESVAFIAIQDTSMIQVAAGVDSLTTIQTEPFLRNVLVDNKADSRFTRHKDGRIFELVHPFNPDNREILRIGLFTRHLEEAKRNALFRAILASVLVLIVGVATVNWVVGRQSYRSLQRAFERIESYTGSILSNMSDAVIAVDSNGRITLVNSAAEQLFGIDAKASLGKSCDQQVPVLCDMFEHALRTRQVTEYEKRVLIGQESLVLSMTFRTIQHDKNNQIEAVFAVVRDVTEQKRLQENLKRKDRIMAMGHLASGVAHEIRNPLNAISMLAQRFKHEFQPVSDNDEYKRMADTMVSETSRINTIIDQFLEFARPVELNLHPVHVSDVFQNIETLLKGEASNRDISFNVECEPELTIHVDVDKMTQAIVNVIRNSIQACAPGDRIDVTCTKQNARLRIDISDSGAGIPSEQLKKIFNLYYSTKEQGTGIGLSVVQQIISQHGGDIDVQSTKGKGTTFTIYLPITE